MHTREHSRLWKHQLGKLEPRLHRHRSARPHRVGVPHHDAVMGPHQRPQQPSLARTLEARDEQRGQHPLCRDQQRHQHDRRPQQLRLAVVDACTGKLRVTGPSLSNGSEVVRVLISPDAHTMATIDNAGNVSLIDAATGKLRQSLTSGDTAVAVADNGPPGNPEARSVLTATTSPCGRTNAASNSGTSTPANPSPSSTAAPQCTTQPFPHRRPTRIPTFHQVDQCPSHPRHGRQLRRPRRVHHRHRRETPSRTPGPHRARRDLVTPTPPTGCAPCAPSSVAISPQPNGTPISARPCPTTAPVLRFSPKPIAPDAHGPGTARGCPWQRRRSGHFAHDRGSKHPGTAVGARFTGYAFRAADVSARPSERGAAGYEAAGVQAPRRGVPRR